MAKYTSGRQKNLKVGIVSYSENLTSLEVIGNVGIGTTIASANLQVNGSVILGGKSTDLINIPGKNFIKFSHFVIRKFYFIR